MPFKVNPTTGKLDYYEISIATDTNLTYTPSPTNGVINSDTGTDATILLADGTNAGLMTAAEKTKLAIALVEEGINYIGDYNNGASYTYDNVVSIPVGSPYGIPGQFFIRVSNPGNPGYPPGTSSWDLLDIYTGSPAFDTWIRGALQTKEDQANKSTSTSLGTSNTLYPTQNAVKVYTDSILGNANALVYKGVIDCSTNPNYPAANAGELYLVSVGGNIGGAIGEIVEIGDMLICNNDTTPSGTQASVGVYWNIIQKNINGAVSGPASSVTNNVALFDGVTGKLIKDSGLTLSGTNTGNQTLAHTSDATTHTATLSSTGGSIKLAEGSGITLTTTGTVSNGIVTIASTSSGTVTSVAALTLGTTGTDVSSSVATGTTTPVITLNLPTASAINRGALSSADWTTFNSKQAALTSGTNIKTINGSSILGSGNLIANNSYLGNTLSMTFTSPDDIGKFATNNYSAAAVTEFRVWTFDTVYFDPWLSKIEGNSSYVLQIGSLQGVYGLYLVTAVTLNTGNDWNAYTLTLISANGTFVDDDTYSISFTKTSLGLTLTTTGSSGAATLVGSTLNVPQYSAGGANGYYDEKPNYTFRGAVLNNNTATVTVEGGVTLSTSASVQSRAVINTNFVSKQIGARYYASVVSTGRYSGTRGTTLLWFMNGGFLYTCDFNISDTAYSPTCQQFYGMQGSILDLNYGGTSTIAVSTLINCIGVGSEAADTNLQIFHNDATGTCTKVDLGAALPANRTAGAISTTVYSVLIYNAPGTNDVKVKVTNAETGVSVENTLSTNLPAATQGLNFFASRAQGTGGGLTNSGQFDLMKLGVYSIL